MRRSALFLLTFPLVSVACVGAAAPEPLAAHAVLGSSKPSASASTSPTTSTRSEAGASELFAELEKVVRKVHVFAPATAKNLGHAWEDDRPALEREFASADTEEKVLVALNHLGNSLHDRHCSFRHDMGSSAGSVKSLRLPVVADVEWRDDKPVFYVARVRDRALDGKIAPGDVITSVDGVPAGVELLARHALESSSNSWFGVALDVADWLSTRRSDRSTVKEGETARWEVRPRSGGGGEVRTVELGWKAARAGSGGETAEIAIDYARAECSDLAHRAYGPYAVEARGRNFCVYGSRDPRRAAFPIVRFFSFRYDSDRGMDAMQQQVRADHESLVHALGALQKKAKTRGVILDLRDNGGGQNPNWFMDWFASGSYTDQFVHLRLDQDFSDPAMIRRAGLFTGRENYLAELKAKTPDQSFTRPRPFFCRSTKDGADEGCGWDNRYTPAHRVTTAPIALVVGPRCVSSCDAISQQFDEYDFGPIVGEPTAAAHTTTRYAHPIVWKGRELGSLHLAFSYEVSGKSMRPIEGVPIHLDRPVPRTFENRDRHDALLVDEAIAALRR